MRLKILKIKTVLVLFFLVGCSSLVETFVAEPKISFASISIRDAKPDGATAVIALNVENPNAISMTVDRLEYSFEMGGRPVASADVKNIASVAGRKTTTIEIPVPFRYDQIFSSVLDLISKGTASYKLNGVARIGFLSLPFSQIGELKIRD